MKKHLLCLVAILWGWAHVTIGQTSTNEYYIESSGGDAFATHAPWDNHSLVLTNNRSSMMWGTTVINPAGQEQVFLQGLRLPFSNSPAVLFDGIYDNSVCGYNLPNPKSRFHGMVNDEISGINQVVVATYFVSEVGTNNVEYGSMVIFSIDPVSGNVNWTRHFTPFGDMTEVTGASIIQDQNGDFVIAYDYRETYPNYLTDSYGIGAAKIDPTGNLLWIVDHPIQMAPVLPDNPFTLHHVFHDVQNGLYVLAGESDLGGVVETFTLSVDEGSGLVVNGMFQYDIPPFLGGITMNNGNYYVTYHSLGGLLGLAEIDPFSGIVTNAWEYDPPVNLNIQGAVTAFPRDLDFNPNTQMFELLTHYTDGVENAYGISTIDANNPTMIQYIEYEYVPGALGGKPVSFVDLQPNAATFTDDRLALIHPDGNALFNPNSQELVKLELFQFNCINASDDIQGFMPNGYSTNFLPMDDVDIQWSCQTKVVKLPYSGRIYDCGGGQIGTYRQAPSVTVDDAIQAPTLKLLPNPAHAYILLDIDYRDALEVRMVDPMGKVVLETTSQTKLDVSLLASGMYILEVKADGQRMTESVLIQH